MTTMAVTHGAPGGGTAMPRVIQDCEVTLQHFAKDLGHEYDEGKEIFVTAKKMYQDMRSHLDQNTLELQKQARAPDEAKKDVELLLAKQEPLWNQLLERAEAQKHRVELLWTKVEEAEKAVNEKRGMAPFNRSWGSYPTKEQNQIRRYYSHKLLPNLKEGKERSNQFIGFPDGYDTRVKLLHKQTKEQSEKFLKETAKETV